MFECICFINALKICYITNITFKTAYIVFITDFGIHDSAFYSKKGLKCRRIHQRIVNFPNIEL